MNKAIPLAACGAAALFAVQAAVNMQKPLAAINRNRYLEPRPEAPPERPAARAAARAAVEPAYKALIRFMNDLDDLLDTIQDEGSFAAVKPKLLSRAREHAAQALLHPNPGMTPMGQFAVQEMRVAVNRHAVSLSRATKAVPALGKFFNDEIGAILATK